jgi:hypothetical protein
MDSQSNDIDSTTESWNKSNYNDTTRNRHDGDETPTVNSTNPNYSPISTTTTTHNWESNNPVVDSIANKGKAELKKGQQQAEDIITKTKRVVKQHCKFNVLDPFLSNFSSSHRLSLDTTKDN